MAEEGKKISFGFAKSIKKPTLVKQVPQEEKKVDYIECLDEKAIKVIGEEEKKEEPLVIPLLGSKTWHDRIVNKIDADIFESKITNENHTQTINIKEEPQEVSNGDLTLVNNSVSNVQIKTELSVENESEALTLEEQAAKEIIEDLKSTDKKDSKLKDLTLPLTEEQNLRGVEESTLDDYEKIPVDAFGLAMLRGMGWKPGKGIGKNEKVVATVVPELRPKGMGLGADKVTLQKQNEKPRKEEEELRMEKGSFIKIIAGKQSNTYGQIEGFDEDAGRLIVKMALGGNTISVNECMVRAVTKAEYLKNSKVLNATKYEEYKSKEGTSKRKSASPASHSGDSDISDKTKKRKVDEDRCKSKKSSKTSKNRRKDTSDSDSDNGSKRKSKKRRSSSSSDTYRAKKVKKSKKHKERDKERERRKDKRSKYSESPDRRKSKKHRRSRSSSRR
ncbi:G-patch domain and KOW motifs-containing protein [Harpegnathos saltator]|uniref:G-patch domain and KOW motifs-containing protein n=1 Tax=Harpegnathos saltator TaxID=610380 RepID=UPI00058B8F49|nr:G-patch domain and KOW motifs-containing protein [Harpegnathos saltator]